MGIIRQAFYLQENSWLCKNFHLRVVPQKPDAVRVPEDPDEVFRDLER